MDLLQDVLVYRLRDLVRHETLPLEEPVGTYHIPGVLYGAFTQLLLWFDLVGAFFPIELQVQNYLLLNLASQLQSLDLMLGDLVWPVQDVVVSFQGPE